MAHRLLPDHYYDPLTWKCKFARARIEPESSPELASVLLASKTDGRKRVDYEVTHKPLVQGLHAMTGTIAVEWALRNLPSRPVYVVGFDTTVGRGDRYATARGTPRHPRWHEPAADRAYLNSLVDAGEVAILSDVLDRDER